MNPLTRDAHSPGVLARDFLIFYLKLLIDGFKGIVLVQIALLAFCVDMVLMLAAGSRKSYFYTVLEYGERFDLWLNLYRPSRGAAANPEGLFGESRAGDDTFVGRVEEIVRRGPEPYPSAGGAPGVGLSR
jgi:hypothetical protein